MEYSDKFSVSRALAYGRLFSPWIQRQLIFYPVISIIIPILSLLLGYTAFGMAFIAILSLIPAMMVYFGSLIFGLHSDRYIETLVPATWCEKATFTVVYSLVVLPLLVNVPTQVVYRISVLIPSIVDGNAWIEVNQLSRAFSSTWLWAIVQSLIPSAVCLLALVVYSNRRILMAVVWTVVSLIGISILGGVIGFMSAINMVKNDADSIKDIEPENVVATLASNMQPALITLGIIGLAIILVIVWLIFRKFRTRQI